jgi:eukaryotic-like serine/threonine-protein kinase
VLDFGVAKATSRSGGTQPGTTKGKLSYMSPEQLRFKTIDRRADVFAAGIVLWEMLTLRRLFRSDDPGLVAMKILKSDIPVPSRFNPQVHRALDLVVAGALAREREARYPTALAFATALEQAQPPASAREVGEWVQATAQESLTQRSRLKAQVEGASARDSGPMQLLSHASSRVPAPEDESVTVRAPLPHEAPGLDEVVTESILTESILSVEPVAPVAQAASVLPVEGAVPGDLIASTPAPEVERTPVLSGRPVPSQLWGAVGIGSFAVAMALAVMLPIRARPLSTVRAAAGAPASPAASSLTVPGPSVEQLPPSAPPPVEEAQEEEPPEELEELRDLAAEPVPPAEEPEVRLFPRRSPDQLPNAPGGKIRPSSPSRRWWHQRNKLPSSAYPELSADCDPPYMLDERGIRRIKPECLTSQ